MSSTVLSPPAAPSAPHVEILDLRHFGAERLRPLLRDEAARWQRRLWWEYGAATEMLLEYLEGRVLPGFVALHNGRVVGYTFCVYEAAKAVVGDVYAFGEAESLANPVCETLLHHLVETLQNTPGVERIESQLLMFPAGALRSPFLSRGFRVFERLFMLWDLQGGARTGNAAAQYAAEAPPTDGLQLLSWQSSFYEPAAELIQASYVEHIDSGINDQYRNRYGSQRFLHNIIRFPGCGTFAPQNSWVLRDSRTGRLAAMVLSSEVSPGVGHVTQLCVSPELRGRGLGRRLLLRCAAQLQRSGGTALSLTVTEANTAARRLYEELGFETHHRFEAMVWQDTE